jgi:hypothetical protein
VAAALRIGKVYGCLVIPRPHEEIRTLIQQADRPHKQKAPVIRAAAALIVEPPAAPEALAETLEPPSAPPDLPTEAPTLELTDEPLPKAQCSAITKSGERCKLPARPGSKYCYFHRRLEN